MGISEAKRKLVRRLRNPRLRAKEGLFLVEGVRSAREFLDATAPVRIRFSLVSPRLARVQGGAELSEALSARKLPVEEVDDRELAALSDTDTTQGILLVVEEPAHEWPPSEGDGPFRLLLLDGVQDPGNVGTLIRAARAFGLDAVLALEGTADPWNPKVVRGAAGASAHLPVLRVAWPEVKEWFRREEIPVLVADPGGEDVRRVGGREAWALVLGNEGAGVRPEIRGDAHGILAIPMGQDVDSLNVALAGAILLFALTPLAPPDGKG